MLTNAYLLAKIGADTAENEQHFAEFRSEIRAAGPAAPEGPPPAQRPAAPPRRRARPRRQASRTSFAGFREREYTNSDKFLLLIFHLLLLLFKKRFQKH